MARYQERKVSGAPPCSPVLPSHSQHSQYPIPSPPTPAWSPVTIQTQQLDFPAGLGHPQQNQHLLWCQQLSLQPYWRTKFAGGIHEMSEGESFVHEEIEAPRETRTWPSTQGQTKENVGPGHVTPGEKCSQKVPIGPPEACSWQMSQSPSPGTSIKYLY